MATRGIRRAGTLVLALLGLAACGGGDDDIATAPGALAVCSTAFDGASSTTSLAKAMRQTGLEASQPAPIALSTCQRDAQGNVTIGPDDCGPRVQIDQSFTGARALGKIIIKEGGALVTPLAPGQMEVQTAGIAVEGLMSIGTQQCPVGAGNPSDQIKIVFTGSRPANAEPSNMGEGTDKGIELRAGGILRLYGAKGVVSQGGVSWTYLSQPAGPESYDEDALVAAPVPAGGQSTLHLADDVQAHGGWRAGDWIVVATSSFSPFESEFVQIESVTPEAGGSKVTLRQPLRHYHFGGKAPGLPSDANYAAGKDVNFGVDERSEVGLISRNIVLTAQTPGPKPNLVADIKNSPADPGPADPHPDRHWGGEIRIMPGFAEASIQGVELEKFGKARRGSYPIHFHMAGEVTPGKTTVLVDSNSVHHSYNKCVTVHGTSGVSITNNVCARAVGHLFYQEMGEEKGSRFIGNLGIGAMSNYFGIDPATAEKLKIRISDGPETDAETETRVSGWWDGDNMAAIRQYDGLNVPNTDNQSVPTHSSCFKRDPNLRDLGALTLEVGGKENPPCAPESFYAEPASGFWLVNPGAELEGNSIAGCQGMGKGYWYVPPADPPAAPGTPGKNYLQKFEKVSFLNNRVHGCYDGLFGETEQGVKSEQLFPTDNGTQSGASVIAHFKGLTATRIRNRGVWIRPAWTAVEQGRFATNRDSVSLVTSGGADGNSPGVWALLKDSVLVGVSKNNVDRWGPCAKDYLGSGQNEGCVDMNPKANELRDKSYQTPRWNSYGYMIYDGPVRIIHNRFVNFVKDVGSLLTKEDRDEVLKKYTGYSASTDSDHPYTPNVYEGDAALGWFQSNQSSYPTATVSRALSFENVDLRHQIYTEKINFAEFSDGDKNTAVIDLDGTLTGYRVVRPNGAPAPGEFPISLNNLEFNHSANAVDECLSEGAQDSDAEGRPSSIISPANVATLEFEGLINGQAQNVQDMIFTKDSLDAKVHQSMLLHSRNGQGVWEPKVASGYGYTVQAPGTARGGQVGQVGIPSLVHVGFTDAVKPGMTKQNPFYVRVGICYATKNGKPSSFTIRRGYKSWGGGIVNQALIRPYYNRLQGLYNNETCANLDFQESGNKAGCPAHGVTPPVAGTCPAPSQLVGDQCVYPVDTLSAAPSLAALTNADGTPADFNKYFYDRNTGMLFFYVTQDVPNAHGAAPTGSCPDKNNPACPDEQNELDTYYPCPPQGCINYSVQVNDPGYQPGVSSCPATAIYGSGAQIDYTLPEPPNANKLAYVGGGLVGSNDAVEGKPGYLHWVPKDGHPSSCKLTNVTP